MSQFDPTSNPRWTPILGLRRAALLVALRAPFAIVGWAALLVVAAPLLNFLVVSLSIFAVLIIVMIAPGVAIGYGLSRGVVDRAGMVGVFVSLIAVVGVVVAVGVGTAAALAFRSIGDWQVGFAALAATIWGTMWSIKMTLFES